MRTELNVLILEIKCTGERIINQKSRGLSSLIQSVNLSFINSVVLVLYLHARKSEEQYTSAPPLTLDPGRIFFC